MIHEIVTTKKCTGCSACYNACPGNCIEMKYSAEGFLIPFVSVGCTKCGLCVKVCPAIQDRKDKMYAKPEVYAAYLKDNVIIQDSTSGGIFIACAKWILQNGGVVCGAVFDKDYFVRLKIIDNMHNLKLLQGSKYVQSIPEKIYREIKDLLQEKKVLFTGLPCQVAGLKTFLGQKYDNLFTIDLICHGIMVS